MAEGLLFHMPGRWRLLFDVEEGGGTEKLALTAPYKHDGRYDTLPQLVRHYGHPCSPAARRRLRALM